MYLADGSVQRFDIAGGFVEVSHDTVSILVSWTIARRPSPRSSAETRRSAAIALARPSSEPPASPPTPSSRFTGVPPTTV